MDSNSHLKPSWSSHFYTWVSLCYYIFSERSRAELQVVTQERRISEWTCISEALTVGSSGARSRHRGSISHRIDRSLSRWMSVETVEVHRWSSASLGKGVRLITREGADLMLPPGLNALSKTYFVLKQSFNHNILPSFISTSIKSHVSCISSYHMNCDPSLSKDVTTSMCLNFLIFDLFTRISLFN